MAIPKWIRRMNWAGVSDSKSPTEVGIYSPAETFAPVEGRMLMIRFDRSLFTPAQDGMVITMHFINYTAGVVDTTWTDADYTAVESQFDTLWTSFKPQVGTKTVLDQYRWYRFAPELEVPGISNPPQRITERNVPGTASSISLAPQTALSVTLRTGIRRSWGRYYLPAQAIGVASSGYYNNTTLAPLATVIGDFHGNCFDNDIHPVVWSPTHKHAYGVEKVQIDDVPDVIRSRRVKPAVTRYTTPIT